MVYKLLVRGRRYYLKRKDSKRILEQIATILNVQVSDFINPDSTFEVMDIDLENKIYFIDGKPAFVESRKKIFPTLLNERVLNQLPYLIVDIGAIPHVCNGADILLPGITKISGDFSVGSFLVILEEKFLKKIAIAKALVNSSEIVNKKQGKIAENIHYVGDKLWNRIKGENVNFNSD